MYISLFFLFVLKIQIIKIYLFVGELCWAKVHEIRELIAKNEVNQDFLKYSYYQAFKKTFIYYPIIAFFSSIVQNLEFAHLYFSSGLLSFCF